MIMCSFLSSYKLFALYKNSHLAGITRVSFSYMHIFKFVFIIYVVLIARIPKQRNWIVKGFILICSICFWLVADVSVMFYSPCHTHLGKFITPSLQYCIRLLLLSIKRLPHRHAKVILSWCGENIFSRPAHRSCIPLSSISSTVTVQGSETNNNSLSQYIFIDFSAQHTRLLQTYCTNNN